MRMDAVDGNAVAGHLHEHFGADMTAARGACAHCGTRAMIAELAVYDRAPGAVARCRSCGSVVMVVVEIHGATHVHHDNFRLTAVT
jgi:DNA-directed RNA polymerase subunit RPC12/RpoP